jgi:hypothetical protein
MIMQTITTSTETATMLRARETELQQGQDQLAVMKAGRVATAAANRANETIENTNKLIAADERIKRQQMHIDEVCLPNLVEAQAAHEAAKRREASATREGITHRRKERRRDGTRRMLGHLHEIAGLIAPMEDEVRALARADREDHAEEVRLTERSGDGLASIVAPLEADDLRVAANIAVAVALDENDRARSMAHVFLIPLRGEPAPGQTLELRLELADIAAFRAGVALLEEVNHD